MENRMSKIALLIVLVIAFFGNVVKEGGYVCRNIDYLAPVSRFSPMLKVEKDGSQYAISEDESKRLSVIQMFQSAAAFNYVKQLAQRYTQVGISEDGVQNLLRIHLADVDRGRFFPTAWASFKYYNFGSNNSGAAQSQNSTLPGKHIQIDAEKAMAGRFMDNLKLSANKASRLNRSIVIAFDTNWIPDEQASFIQPLISALMRLHTRPNLNNIIVLRAKGSDLAAELIKMLANPNVRPSHVIVLADETTAFSDVFTAFKGTGSELKLFLAGVDAENLTPYSYVRLLEMLDFALKIAFKETVSVHHPFINIERIPGDRRLVDFQPKAEPVDPKELKEIYQSEMQAVR
jgi:hypothetical protein